MSLSEPYLIPTHSGVRVVPLITVPETAPNGYHMAGVPDGIGAFRSGEHTFDVLLTHELRYNHGKARAHAGSGAFVSRWRFDTQCWDGGRGTLRLKWGEDLIKHNGVHFWNHQHAEYHGGSRVPLERLCSADLPAKSALYFEDHGGKKWGTTHRLFLGGEETHSRYKPESGRALAHVVTGCDKGSTWELPRLGRGSWENVLACPVAQRKTVVFLPDDATAHVGPTWRLREPTSELYVFVGEKQAAADPSLKDFQKAGLHDGTLYGVQILTGNSLEALAAEHHELGLGGLHSNGAYLADARFTLVPLPDQARESTNPSEVTDYPGIRLQKQSLDARVTQFFRPEDGAWDPRPDRGNEFWVVTTGDADIEESTTRLYHFVFDDIAEPQDGGTVHIALGGRGGNHEYDLNHLDSACVDPDGFVLLQEDPDDAPAVTRTMIWDPDTEQLRIAASGNPDLFGDCNHPRHLTQNEESAGIVPVFRLLGEGWYLVGVQCNDREAWRDRLRPRGLTDAGWEQLQEDLYRPGQLLALHIPREIISQLPLVESRDRTNREARGMVTTGR